jgi:hypothetical protein
MFQWARQLPGSSADGRPYPSQSFLTKEYVPATSQRNLPASFIFFAFSCCFVQSLPRPQKVSPNARASSEDNQVIDPDSELAHTLQPLLEQEALLESFVEEAKARRKFEDAKTLKANLVEIRAEIDKIFANGNGAAAPPVEKANAKKRER